MMEGQSLDTVIGCIVGGVCRPSGKETRLNILHAGSKAG